MTQNYTRDEIHREMRRIHDEVKRHPFRVGFEARYIPEYKNLLYELSRQWANLIWHCSGITDEETRLLRQFGGWIHDYRQELRTYHKDTFPMELFPYYEQMLQITHIYLDTGEFNVYYNPDPFWDENDKRYCRVEKYQLITKEMCGIDSPVLPGFFAVTTRSVTDERVREYFLKEKYYNPPKSETERLELYAEWVHDVKPILDWINAGIKDRKWEHRPWRSLR